ncbi:MAG: OmpA family protein [Phycisphaerales bacterium]
MRQPRFSRTVLRLVLPLAAFSLAGLGCVPQQRYDELMTAYRGKEQQLLSTQNDLDTAKNNERVLRGQLLKATEDIRSLERMRDGSSSDLDRLVSDYDRLQRQLVELGAGPLPAEVIDALTELATRYPEVLEFDAQRGVVRFAADFTFPLGSVELSESARQALRTFAGILASDDADSLEVRIVGHTDNVPIRRAETRAKHPSNLHLSAHRAIAVRDAFVAAGLSPQRFSVVGYGEYRPIVANARNGAPQNRRVEVFLTPMLIPTGSGAELVPAETIVQVEDDEPTK